ncbi:MAG TPA: hypothetical protein VFX46_07165 [Hyphomicrobiaceae bacterium]|jgi:hypothetical protein|nr:MAG: hypothetical protein DIU57_13545 [Pseudomonadota bacterium]HEX5600397.1 hypothetical protein [Hyphomicrobiaceae bacterium]
MQAVSEAEDQSDSFKALSLILEAWDEGAEQGIPSELMAYAALYTALTDLVSAFGEEAVANMTRSLDKRVRQGEFTIYGTTQ